jgi:hypothetical protein
MGDDSCRAFVARQKQKPPPSGAWLRWRDSGKYLGGGVRRWRGRRVWKEGCYRTFVRLFHMGRAIEAVR